VPWDIYAETHARAEWCTTYKGEVQKGVGLVFGFPTWNAVIPKYEYNIGYHVCDVSSIPERWVKGMNLMDHILTPSHWCAQVFGACGVKPERTVVPHGVSVEYQEGVEPSDDTFCFLHFCSAEDPTRKGTLRLVEAFETVYKAMPGARLEIHSDSTLVRVRVEASECDRISCVPQAYTSKEGQAVRLQRAHVVVAPSRAEGFGGICLEALCVGTPIVATDCTGHATWAKSIKGGAAWVRTSELTPCGSEHGLAPRLLARNISTSLLYSYSKYGTLRSEALARRLVLGEAWAWHKVLQKLRAFLLEIRH